MSPQARHSKQRLDARMARVAKRYGVDDASVRMNLMRAYLDYFDAKGHPAESDSVLVPRQVAVNAGWIAPAKVTLKDLIKKTMTLSELRGHQVTS